MKNKTVIKKIIIRKHKLFLKNKWITSKSVLSYREGWIVFIQTVDSISGYGDCFPMPDMGTENLPESLYYAKHLKTVLQGKTVAESFVFLKINAINYPNTHFGFETALLTIKVKKERYCSIAGLLNNRHKKILRVNDNLGVLHKIQAIDIQNSIKQGYQIIKIKAGVLPVDDEIKKLHEISRLLPSTVQLRIDVNQAWDINDAVLFFSKAKLLPIESIEEPLKNPSIELLDKLQSLTKFIIAIDESLPFFIKNDFIFSSSIKRFIIKPALLGGLRASVEVAKKAQKNHIKCIVTSMVESFIGRLATIQLAAAIDKDNVAHGLSTSKWLKENIDVEEEVKNGFVEINCSNNSCS